MKALVEENPAVFRDLQQVRVAGDVSIRSVVEVK